jgi:hypothetical protein
MGHRDLFFLQAAEGQGVFACSDWSSGFLFSWEVRKILNEAKRILGACSGTVGAALGVYFAEFLGFARLRPISEQVEL